MGIQLNNTIGRGVRSIYGRESRHAEGEKYNLLGCLGKASQKGGVGRRLLMNGACPFRGETRKKRKRKFWMERGMFQKLIGEDLEERNELGGNRESNKTIGRLDMHK